MGTFQEQDIILLVLKTRDMSKRMKKPFHEYGTSTNSSSSSPVTQSPTEKRISNPWAQIRRLHLRAASESRTRPFREKVRGVRAKGGAMYACEMRGH